MNSYKVVYFLGIGGIGMSALARYFHRYGVQVSGYDKTPTALTHQLIEEGIPIHFIDDPALVPSHPDLVVYTPALPKDSKELQVVIENGFLLRKRAEVLGLITRQAKTIAIAGTHGKTTITSMVAHIMQTARKESVSFLGGISKNYHSNLILSDSFNPLTPNSGYYVVEADEFDRSFLQLYPDIAIITSSDADHLDIYGCVEEVRLSFGEFTSHIQENGTLVLKKGIGILPQKTENYTIYTYSIDKGADF